VPTLESKRLPNQRNPSFVALDGLAAPMIICPLEIEFQAEHRLVAREVREVERSRNIDHVPRQLDTWSGLDM